MSLKKAIKIGRWDIMIWYRETPKREVITVPYKEAELLPCPFCGSDAEYCVNAIPTHWIRCSGFLTCTNMVRMGCESCSVYECHNDIKTELCEYLIYGWNQRPTNEPPPKG